MKPFLSVKQQRDEELIREMHMTPAMQVWKRLCRNKVSVVCMFFICALILVAYIVPAFMDPNLAIAHDTANRIQPPSKEHWFGTDLYGRDLFIRVLFGARISLTIGLITTAVSTIVGCLLGAIAAYYGGFVDDAIMRMCDVFMAIPEQLLAICVVASLGATSTSLIVALSIAVIPGRARLVRSTVLGVIGSEYVEAAKAAGMRDLGIICKELLPNSLGPLIIGITQGMAGIMLTASSLSFLGVGIQPPEPEWGSIIAEAREFLRIAPYMCVLPGIVMVLVALAFSLLGDGLRDALDPRLKD